MHRRATTRDSATMKPPIRPNRRTVLQSLGAGLASSAALSGAATAHRGGLKGELAEVRSATAEYNDQENAYDDGYVAIGRDEDGDPYVIPLKDVTEEAHSVCGMGYHFINEDLMGTEDRTRPQVLVYGEGDDGDLILGAVEYIIPKDMGYESQQPQLFGHADGDEEDWAEDNPFSGVWSLHVWVHNKNPDGVFAPFNPRDQFCPSGSGGHH